MSIEAKIDALTSAVEALTKVMEGGMSAKTTTTASTKDTEEKKPATRRSTKPKAPTAADMKKAAESFLDKAGKDEDNYADRRAHIKKVIAKFDSPKFTEIGEDDRQEAIDMLADFDKDDDGGSSRDNDDNDI